MDGMVLKIAHNGVRSDDNDVEVREPRRVSNRITKSDEEDDIMLGRSLLGIGMCALVLLLSSNAVFAQQAPAAAPTGTVQERLTELEKKTDAVGLWKTLGFQLSGGVSVAYNHNFGNPGTNLSQLRTSDANTNSFVPQLAQVILQKPADEQGTGAQRAGFRARLNFGPDARISRARNNFLPGTDNTELDFQELYAEYIAPIGNGLKIQAGKINTALGYETFTSWENPNFSRTYGYNLSQAFTTTGIRLTYVVHPMLTVMAAVNNGWDNIEDNNQGKMAEGAITLTLHPRFINYFYGSWAAEQSNNRGQAAAINPTVAAGSAPGCSAAPGTTGCDPTAHRTVLDYIGTLKPTDSDTVILEIYYVNEVNASTLSKGHNGRWNSAYLYLIHDFNDQMQPHAVSARFRGGYFEDAGGIRACTGAITINGGNNTCAGATATGTSVATAQVVTEYTFTLQYAPFPNLITRTEFRYDHSNKNVFLHRSEATNNQATMTYNLVYLF